MSRPVVLVADDDRAIRMVLDRALTGEGYEVRATDNCSTLWSWVEAGEGDIVITDVRMPDVNGLDLVPQIHQIRSDIKIIVMSAQSTLLTAVKAIERGAYEYIPKPFDLNELIGVLERALSSPENAQAQNEVGEEEKLPIIGKSPAMQEIYRTVARLMTSDLTVMISGESGTGKELVARALHDFGQRRGGAFIAINMAAIPRELIEAELFGYEKGSFTGAHTSGIGRFQQAQNGTLFLDEIGDMPIEAQTRLLRVLQEGEFTTVGGRTPIKADVRIVSATHRDLEQLVKKGQFREDLFYRLNVVPMRLPPLRDRKEDIADLARYFLNKAPASDLPLKTIAADGLIVLNEHQWPGNVRELENLMYRITALYTEPVISAAILKQEISQISTPVDGSYDEGLSDNLSSLVERYLINYFDSLRGNLPRPGLHSRIIDEVEKPLISITLRATKGNQLKASDLLGLNRNTLRKKIRDLDIDFMRRRDV
ncbi:MAG: nitrogen regulation protein NR(I) [Pseudomonadota bacterium]|nr:nitrogen regulation protein NR(I) [Pseudomonadota bacterium]